MKKYLIAIMPFVIALILSGGCRGQVDYNHKSTYIYKNESSNDIILKSYYQLPAEKYRDTTFIIPKGKFISTAFYEMSTICYPFSWHLIPVKDSLIISNSKEQFIQRSWEGGKLYSYENYELINSSEHSSTFQYTFTDADFENAEPVE